MKIKDNYKVRKIAGENLIVAQGATHSDLTKVITLNSTALFLWEKLLGKDFSADDAAALLVEEYGVDPQTARQDADKWIDVMTTQGIFE